MATSALKLKLHAEPKGGRDDEMRFHIRVGKIVDDSKGKEKAMGRAIQALFRAITRVARPNNGQRPMRGAGVFKAKPHELTQKSTTKTTFVRNIGNKMMAAGAYMERDGELKGFDAMRDEMSPKEQMAEWSDERYRGKKAANFTKIMISPQRELDPEQLRELARASMKDIEKEIGCDLRWCAAVHHDEGHPHIHIAIYGRDTQNRAVRLDPKYVHNRNSGLGLTVREALTRQIGQRQEQDIAKDRAVNRADMDEKKRRLKGQPTWKHRGILTQFKKEVAERKKREAAERTAGGPLQLDLDPSLSKDERAVRAKLNKMLAKGMPVSNLDKAVAEVRQDALKAKAPSKATADVSRSSPKAPAVLVKAQEQTEADRREQVIQARVAKLPEHMRASALVELRKHPSKATATPTPVKVAPAKAKATPELPKASANTAKGKSVAEGLFDEPEVSRGVLRTDFGDKKPAESARELTNIEKWRAKKAPEPKQPANAITSAALPSNFGDKTKAKAPAAGISVVPAPIPGGKAPWEA